MPRSTDKKIDFATRHFKSIIRTFNAASAIWRAEQLRDEIIELDDKLGDFTKKEPYKPLEFLNYYIVGFVTCLEWHARSRLSSLLSYDPRSFTPDDIKQSMTVPMLEQILHQQLTVAQFVAASTNISDLSRYLGVFDRIFNHLGIDRKATLILKEGQEDPDAYYVFLTRVFERRHALVHEIDHTQVGHWNLRDRLSFEETKTIAIAVLSLMENLEKVIWSSAPKDFPDLLPPSTDYGSRSERIRCMIEEVENRMLAITEGLQNLDIDTVSFNSAIRLSRQHISAEIESLRSAVYTGHQYFKVAEPLIADLLENRLRYVKEVEKRLRESGVFYDFDSLDQSY